MNKENIICNVSKYFEENRCDILKQVSNIVYLFEHLAYEESPEKEFCDRVNELKYTPYTGQLLIESVASWCRRYWHNPKEMYWRIEIIIEGENDEYVRFINWLYYESIRFSLENNFLGDLIEHISCVFQREAKEEVEAEMKRTANVQEMKRNKRLEIDFMKLHYKYDDERITLIEKSLYEVKINDIPEIFKRIRIHDLMTFMLICSTRCKELIYNGIGEDGRDEINKFQGDAMYLRRENIAKSLEYLMHCVR